MMLLVATAFAVDLDTTRARAIEQAVTVERAAARAQSARGNTWLAASGALPQVDLFASGSVGAGLTSFGFERPVATQGGLGLTGSWTLIAPGAWAATSAARSTAKGQEALLDWARVMARRDATVAVADLWVAQEQAEAWRTAADDAEQAQQAVQSLVDSGLRPAADLARSRATAASLRALAIQSAGQVVGACAQVEALVRDPIDGRCDPVTLPSETMPGPAPGEHPALVAAELALRAAKAARTGVVLDRVPTLTATGTAAEYIAGDASGFGWSAGAEARMPLLGSRGVGDVTQANAALDDAALAFEAQRLELEASRLGAQARHDAAVQTVAALELAVAAAEEALELVDARYREGLEPIEAWLAARRLRDEARANLAAGRGAALSALADLESVRGVW